MTEKCFGAQKTQSDIRGLAPFLQNRRMREIFRSGTMINHGNNNLKLRHNLWYAWLHPRIRRHIPTQTYLSAFQRNDVGIFRSADNTVITSDFLESVDTEEIVAVAVAVCEILPRLKRRSMIGRTFEHPSTGTRRVREFQDDIGNVEYLSTRITNSIFPCHREAYDNQRYRSNTYQG